MGCRRCCRQIYGELAPSEKILFHRDASPVAYDQVVWLRGHTCAEIRKGQSNLEAGHIIGLKDGAGGSVTLEPGGQLVIRCTAGKSASNLR